MTMDNPIVVEPVEMEPAGNPTLISKVLQNMLDPRGTIKIYGDGELPRDGHKDGAVSLPTFSYVVARARDADNQHVVDNFPIHRFRLQKWIYKPDPTVVEDEEVEREWRLELQLDFWRNCGRWMTHLELAGCEFWDIRHFRDILFLHTPNLEDLQLRGCRFRFPFRECRRTSFPYERQQGALRKLHICEYNGQATAFEWNEIFAAFPNLNTLAISNEQQDEPPRSSGLEDINKLVTTFAEMRDRGIQCHLKHLDITGLHGEIYEDTVTLFQRAHLHLETLKIDIASTSTFTCFIDEEVVAPILALQAPTLETLDVISKQVFNETVMGGVGGVPYRNLKELRVHISNEDSQTFSFLQLTPALQLLHIHGDGECSVPEIGDVGDPRRLAGLVELHMDYTIRSAEEFSSLTAWMPNMARVKMPLTSHTFGVMVAGWKGTLKELHILGSGENDDVGDAEITGIPWKLLESSNSAVGVFENFERNPNITNLTVLEKFSMGATSRPLSQHSLKHGFSHLGNLESLQIYVEDEIPSNMMQHLEEKIYDLRVIRVVKPVANDDKSEKSEIYSFITAELLVWMISGWLIMLAVQHYFQA